MKLPRLTWPVENPKTRLRNAPVIDRLMYRTALGHPSGCWIWLGATNTKGYGNIWVAETARRYSVHRVAYEHYFGPIPVGLEVDHLCSQRRCVNPVHLEAVTHAENVNRGRHNQNHRKTHCHRGHEFTEANTTIDTLGKRVCKTCARRRTAEYRARKAVA